MAVGGARVPGGQGLRAQNDSRFDVDHRARVPKAMKKNWAAGKRAAVLEGRADQSAVSELGPGRLGQRWRGSLFYMCLREFHSHRLVHKRHSVPAQAMHTGVGWPLLLGNAGTPTLSRLIWQQARAAVSGQRLCETDLATSVPTPIRRAAA